MPSFDVVCRTDFSELDNAVNGVGREIKQRYDLKGTACSIVRRESNIIITADDNMLLRQMHELLQKYCARRGVDDGVLDYKLAQDATKGTLRQDIVIREGIDEAIGKQIIKEVKGSKLKVRVAIQGDELRVTGKNRDDLQQAIGLLKDMKLDIPLQYINFRD